ncbi:MAG: polysaccharide deacetylase family protein [Planctomycetota bacterium]
MDVKRVNDQLTIRIEKGKNLAARQWAAQLLAARIGMPFQIAHLERGQRPAAGPSLYYGNAEGFPGVSIRASGFFDGDLRDSPGAPGSPAELEGTPVPFGSGEVRRTEGASAFGPDLLASAFYLANRVEERDGSAVDEHGRFPASRWASLVRKELERLYPSLSIRRPWPSGEFAVCITHDVETLTPIKRAGYLKAELAAAARNITAGRPLHAAGRIVGGAARFITGGSPSWSFRRLRRGEGEAGGTYFFFGGANSDFDAHYDVRSPRIRRAIADLCGDGCEIGAHLSYETGANAESMCAQRAVLEEGAGAPVIGSRYHYLRAHFPEAWAAHEEAGFTYDSSLGFADAEGFRGGTSFPYRPFLAGKGRPAGHFSNTGNSGVTKQ